MSRLQTWLALKADSAVGPHCLTMIFYHHLFFVKVNTLCSKLFVSVITIDARLANVFINILYSKLVDVAWNMDIRIWYHFGTVS